MSNEKPTETYEDRHGNYYIRYNVTDSDGIAIAVEAAVWEVAEWSSAGRPVLFNAGPKADRLSWDSQEPLCTLLVKWDGCSHLRLPYLHFDGMEAFGQFQSLVAYIYDDICERHGIGD